METNFVAEPSSKAAEIFLKLISEADLRYLIQIGGTGDEEFVRRRPGNLMLRRLHRLGLIIGMTAGEVQLSAFGQLAIKLSRGGEMPNGPLSP